jgi:hypothetical protein
MCGDCEHACFTGVAMTTECIGDVLQLTDTGGRTRLAAVVRALEHAAQWDTSADVRSLAASLLTAVSSR